MCDNAQGLVRGCYHVIEVFIMVVTSLAATFPDGCAEHQVGGARPPVPTSLATGAGGPTSLSHLRQNTP